MHIFIDESGTFSDPGGKQHAISCVASLVLRSKKLRAILLRFQEMKRRWGYGDAEAKGRDLDEQQVREVLLMLLEFDALVFVRLIDMGLERAETVRAAKMEQAAKFTERLTSKHKPGLVRDLEGWKATMESLHDQLFVQFCLLIDLIPTTLMFSTIHLVQRHPPELGHFCWTADAKQHEVTDYEALWRRVVLAAIQDRSLKGESFPILRGEDYSHFRKFEINLPEIPEHLRPAMPDHAGPFLGLDVRMLMDDLSFKRSSDDTGLQLADIVANSTRRALVGNLQESAWRHLGPLMIRAKGHIAPVSGFPDAGRPTTLDVPYAQVIRAWTKAARAAV